MSSITSGSNSLPITEASSYPSTRETSIRLGASPTGAVSKSLIDKTAAAAHPIIKASNYTDPNTQPIAPKLNFPWAQLLNLIPGFQGTEEDMKRCQRLMGKVERQLQNEFLQLIGKVFLSNREEFLEVIEPLLDLELKGESKLLFIKLVSQGQIQSWQKEVDYLRRIPTEDLEYFSSIFNCISFQVRDEVLRIVAPTLKELEYSEWSNVLALANTFSHLPRTLRKSSGEDCFPLEEMICEGIRFLLATKEDVRKESIKLFEMCHRENRNIAGLKSCVALVKKRSAEGNRLLINQVYSWVQKRQEKMRLSCIELIYSCPHTVQIFAALLSPLQKLSDDWNPVTEGFTLLKYFSSEDRLSIAEWMKTIPFEQLGYIMGMVSSLPQEKKDAILHMVVPRLYFLSEASDWVDTLQIALLLSHQVVPNQEDPSNIQKAFELLDREKEASARANALAFFALLPKSLRNLNRLETCIKMVSIPDFEDTLIAFKGIPEAKKGVVLDMLTVQVGLVEKIGAANFVHVLTYFPEGEEKHICEALENAWSTLPTVKSDEALMEGIKLFGLLPREHLNPQYLKMCLDLFVDNPEENEFVKKASAKEMFAVVKGLLPEERALFLQQVNSLKQIPERGLLANIMGLFALLPKDQREQKHLLRSKALLQDISATEGKGIVEEVKLLAKPERDSFFKIGVVQLGKEAKISFKREVLTLFASFLSEERTEDSLLSCIKLLSGEAKYWERDKIVAAIKRLSEAQRASFVKNHAAQLSQVEDMQERVSRVEMFTKALLQGMTCAIC